jgi:hypothetical protein
MRYADETIIDLRDRILEEVKIQVSLQMLGTEAMRDGRPWGAAVESAASSVMEAMKQYLNAKGKR